MNAQDFFGLSIYSNASTETGTQKSALPIQFLLTDLWELICSLSTIKNSPKISEQSGESLSFLIRSTAEMYYQNQF